MSSLVAPYTWEEIAEQIRLAILAQASILGQFGPDGLATVQSYLGIDVDTWEADYMEKGQAASIPLERHVLFHQVKRAYLYAYQLDGFDQASSEDWHEMPGLLEGFPQTNYAGEPSPLCKLNDFPLRRVLETFFARWSWYEEENDLSIRQLSLLANMTIPAVRTSLSKEGFKLEQLRGSDSRRDDGSTARLSYENAKEWLSRRRGFIPNRQRETEAVQAKSAEELLFEPNLAFPDMLKSVIEVRSMNYESLSESAGCSLPWLEKLADGLPVEIDISAFRTVARSLSLPEPEFVSRAVRYVLELEEEGL